MSTNIDGNTYTGGTFANDLSELFFGPSENSSAGVQYQRNLQLQQQAQQFNSAEAARSRDWQEYMSNTAHQRELVDLKAAGLNPILAANGGAPATAGGSATSSINSASKSNASHEFVGLLKDIFSLAHSAKSESNRIEAQKDVNKSKAIKNLADAAYVAKLFAKISV